MTTGRYIGKLQRHRAVSLRQHGFLVTEVTAAITDRTGWYRRL